MNYTWSALPMFTGTNDPRLTRQVGYATLPSVENSHYVIYKTVEHQKRDMSATLPGNSTIQWRELGSFPSGYLCNW